MKVIIKVNGKNWEELTEEEKKKAKIQLNDQAMAAAGYARDNK